jgi:hypothetical protein
MRRRHRLDSQQAVILPLKEIVGRYDAVETRLKRLGKTLHGASEKGRHTLPEGVTANHCERARIFEPTACRRTLEHDEWRMDLAGVA